MWASLPAKPACMHRVQCAVKTAPKFPHCLGAAATRPPAVAAVVHVVDAVLMPTGSLQQVLPYNQAVGGLQAAGTGQPIGPPPPAEPGQPACYPSIAAAVNAKPQLSIFKTVLGLSGVRRQRCSCIICVRGVCCCCCGAAA